MKSSFAAACANLAFSLAIQVFLKVIALGTTIFHHKLELFDVVIVLVSFGLDVGLSYDNNNDNNNNK